MNKLFWIMVSVVGLVLSILVINNWEVFFPPKDLSVAEKQKIESFKDSINRKDVIQDNEWTPFMSVKDTLSVLKVVYREKYGLGSLITVYCTAIFDNKKTNEYKCIAPWLPKLVLQKSNLVSFDPKVIQKKEMDISVQ